MDPPSWRHLMSACATRLKEGSPAMLGSPGAVDPTMEDVAGEDLIRFALLRLLLDSLNLPSPHLGHLLLGFNVAGKLSSTDLIMQMRSGTRDHPAAGSPSCLRVALQLLSSPGFSETRPRLAEMCIQLVCRLCADPATASPTMALLRHRSISFYATHIRRLPHTTTVPGLNSLGWLLRTVARELHAASSISDPSVHASLPQRSHTQRLVAELFDLPLDQEPHDSDSDADGHQPRVRILQALDTIFLAPQPPVPPVLSRPFWLHSNVESCVRTDPGETPVYDLRLLHRIVAMDRRHHEISDGPLPPKDRADAEADGQAVIKAAAAANLMHTTESARIHALSGWRQAVEVVLGSAWTHVPPERREAVLHDLLGACIGRMADTSHEVESALAAPIAAAVLAIVGKMREQARWACWVEGGIRTPLSPQECQAFLQHTVSGLTRPTTSQATRGNLYGALLHFLRYLRLLSGNDPTVGVEAKEEGEMEIVSVTALAMSAYALIEVAGRDASGGPNAWTAVSLATIDALVSKQGPWLEALNQRGFLRRLVEGIPVDVRRLLDGQTSPALLFVYEARLALLTRLAQQHEGAHALLLAGVLTRLGDCPFPRDAPHGSSVTPVGLILPALRLVACIASALSRSREAADQVAMFVSAHADLICHTLARGSMGAQPEGEEGEEEGVWVEAARVGANVVYSLIQHSDVMEERLAGYATRLGSSVSRVITSHATAAIPTPRSQWASSIRDGRESKTWETGADSGPRLGLLGTALSCAWSSWSMSQSHVDDVIEDVLVPTAAAAMVPTLDTLVQLIRRLQEQLTSVSRSYESVTSKLNQLHALSHSELRDLATWSPSAGVPSPDVAELAREELTRLAQRHLKTAAQTLSERATLAAHAAEIGLALTVAQITAGASAAGTEGGSTAAAWETTRQTTGRALTDSLARIGQLGDSSAGTRIPLSKSQSMFLAVISRRLRDLLLRRT